MEFTVQPALPKAPLRQFLPGGMMTFFLLQSEAILLGIARVYKRCAIRKADLSYDGSLVPFIGASGALLLLGVRGGSHMAVAWRSKSPPPFVRPWTRSIANKDGRGGRPPADRAVLLQGR